MNKALLGVIAAALLTLVAFEYEKRADAARQKAEDQAYTEALQANDKQVNSYFRETMKR